MATRIYTDATRDGRLDNPANWFDGETPQDGDDVMCDLRFGGGIRYALDAFAGVKLRSWTVRLPERTEFSDDGAAL